ncbi:MAG: DNA cytosine methyltransferase [Prevotella sp.]|nr:DNA cytosine methyltransferase [Prevotella sp.]
MTHASVFSGIGGPEVAASMLGWENLFHCEINPFGRIVLDYWYPNAESYEDIAKTDFTRWQGRVDVLTGGFPCQPFSVAGQRRGAQDDRYLWPHMHRCICEVKPAWVVCENVGGILSMVEQGRVSEVASETALFGAEDTIHRYVERSTFTLERICRDLEADGYSVQPVLIPACAVGAPHRRDRVFIVGHRDYGDAAHAAQPGTEGVRQAGQDAVHRPLAAADTGGDRGCKVDEHMEPELTDGAEPERNGRKRDAANATNQRTGELRDASKAERPRVRNVVFGNSHRLHCSPDELGARWRGFPTVAPIYGGGHGLPFPVDDLTVSFSHWKNESIKAYGNAIVPQVMYEIFRAIEQVERGTAE